MDKKWKNLIIVIALIIVIVLGYLVLSGNFSLFESKSIDEGYVEILNIFERNDVNLENVQTLNMVYSDENGVVNWIENKANLSKVKSDLGSFKNNLFGYSQTDKSELSSVATIYIHAIDFALASEQRLNKIVSIMANNELNCNDLSPLMDVNSSANSNYIDKYNLAAEVDDFAYNYDPYSEILTIDLDEDYAYLISMHSLINLAVSECAEGI
jgi:flagellar basal body-associated protein FliL